MTGSNPKQIVDEKNGIMIRVDKTLQDLMNEKPSSRWESDYWHPKYDIFFSSLARYFKTENLGFYILSGVDGITYGQVGQRIYDENGKIQYLQVSNIKSTGVDIYEKFAKVKINSHNDPERSRLNNKDLLLLNGGVGSIGRACVFIGENQKTNISQDIDRIRFSNKINPFYVTVFLNSKLGQIQIQRFTKGVSGQTKIGFDHVRSIKISVIPNKIQENIEKEYSKMHEFHEKAMEAKKGNNESEYRENLKMAEKRLEDLIKKTEQVIRGERKDVV